MMSLIGLISILVVGSTILIGFGSAQGTSKDLFRCRQVCYEKFVQDWHHCMDFEDCKNMCITPPNINNYIPEAFSFLCWNSCDQTLGPFQLNVQSASRQGSLVLTDIAWDQAVTNASKQCLVTWEVSGGGLMGNLLTDSSTVELSLWPDTVYHVQVTCKNKETGGMRRSFKLIVDTRKLSGTVSTMQPIAIDTGIKTIPGIFPTESLDIDNTDARMKILKDSSKDFGNLHNNDLEINSKLSTPIASINNEPSSTEVNPIIKSETTIHSSSSNNNQNPSIYGEVLIPRIPIVRQQSVFRSKLAASKTVTLSSSDIMYRNFVCIFMAMLALLFGIAVTYAVLTSRKENVAVDKQNLIQNELTPAGRTLHV